MSDVICQRLSQFALTVDIVDHATHDLFKTEVSSYLENSARADIYEVYLDGAHVRRQENGREVMSPALKLIWCKQFTDQTINLPIPENYQTTHAYVKGSPLWIVAKDGETLETDRATVIDSWSGATDLPSYRALDFHGMRTAIIIPLKYGDRIFGVLNLEFLRQIRYSAFAAAALTELAEAVSRIIWLHHTYNHQIQDTKHAFENLRQVSALTRSPLDRMRVFLACPTEDQVDKAVLGAIRKTLAEHATDLDVVYWKDVDDSGSVTDQIFDSISSSDFGICYFSELGPSHQPTAPNFLDNPNVLFESGMMQVLARMRLTHFQGWLPIREAPRYCCAAPFDITNERILEVPRLQPDGALNTESLAEKLGKRLDALFGIKSTIAQRRSRH
jgi:GAF domain-containing protein